MAEPIEIYPAGETKNPFWKGLINWLIYFVILAAAYWFVLPPLHYQSKEFWHFVLFALILRLVMSGFSAIKKVFKESEDLNKKTVKQTFGSLGKLTKGIGIASLVIVLFLLVGSVWGWQIFHAGSYANLLTTHDGDFAADVAEISTENIPVVDKDTASRLGLRKLGEMTDLVSQFEVDETYYTQINYQGNPYRVTPLEYGDAFKWLGNRKQGIPAYLTVNMVTQETTLVRLEQGIKYSNTEYFMRYLPRYLRFQYPTKMFDNISFELDEQGTPYYVASTYSFKIGLFNGRDMDGAVLCNALTGECEYFPKDQIPTWVDQLYRSDMIIEQLTYNGKYQSGYWNSIFGQKGVLQPTDGYNYIAMNDDVYLYTGITSAAGDESNLGFVLVNMRTKETAYYTCPGAEEYSAMSSAQGMVQDLGYSATFPILLNVNDRPTYFVSLKDSAGLVKMYAYIDVQQYQVVGTGTTLQSAKESYAQKLKEEANIDTAPNGDTQKPATVQVKGAVEQIVPAVVEGNTRYYIRLKGDATVYVAEISVNPALPFVKAGDSLTLTVPEQTREGVAQVSQIELN